MEAFSQGKRNTSSRDGEINPFSIDQGKWKTKACAGIQSFSLFPFLPIISISISWPELDFNFGGSMACGFGGQKRREVFKLLMGEGRVAAPLLNNTFHQMQEKE